jgi:ankyrin repeat protein
MNIQVNTSNRSIKNSLDAGENPYISEVRTYLHLMAEKGSIKLADKKLLTKENLLMLDSDGNTIIHAAAKYGILDQIPKEFLTKENLQMINYNGRNVFHTCAQIGNYEQIPKVLRPHLLKSENLKIKNDTLENCYHILARLGYLGKLAELENLGDEGLNNKVLLEKGPKGQNCFQIAADNKRFDNYLVRLLDRPAIAKQNKDQENLLHVLAKHGLLNTIPEELLNDDFIQLLHSKDKFNRTPICVAAAYGHIDQIRDLEKRGKSGKFVTKEILLNKDILNRTILHHLDENEYNRYLKMFSTRELKELASEKSLKIELINKELRDRKIKTKLIISVKSLDD